MPTHLEHTPDQDRLSTIVADPKSLFFERDLRAERSRALVDALGQSWSILRQSLTRVLVSQSVPFWGLRGSSRPKQPAL
jgi:hypothetical protein